ncbi:MAG: hypothetical protein SXA11_02440 [Cyanobacteriota bacterium]|nr:hypothetical protein [Cyanobacteriota bacterium]
MFFDSFKRNPFVAIAPALQAPPATTDRSLLQTRQKRSPIALLSSEQIFI